MCMISEGEGCEVWRESWHKARKAMRCSSCSDEIRPGQRYMRHFHVYDGDATSEMACLLCGEAREKFEKEHHGIQGGPSNFTYMLNECVAEGDADSKRWVPVRAALIERNKAALAQKGSRR